MLFLLRMLCLACVFARVPRKGVRDPSRSRMLARQYAKIDTPSERECPLLLLFMQEGMGGPVGPGNAGVGAAQSLKFRV